MRSKSMRFKRRREKLIIGIKLINISVFVITLAFFSIASVVLPKKTMSEIEKRKLASFPAFSAQSFLSGEYFKNIENYYNDTFPFREEFVNLASSLKEAKGVRQGEEEIKIYTVKNK